MTITLFEPLTKPTAAQLNAIGADQVILAALYGGASVELMQPLTLPLEDDIWRLYHRYRWLLYNSTGELVDLAGAEDPVSLPDPATGYGLKDLDEIPWLAYGQIYKVTGCEFAYERRDPPTG